MIWNLYMCKELTRTGEKEKEVAVSDGQRSDHIAAMLIILCLSLP